MALKPLRDHVLVRPAEHTGMSKGGIHLPNEEKPFEGTVVAVGDGAVRENGQVVPVGVQAGSVVLFSKHAGTELKLDGEKFLLMREDDLLAVRES